MRDSKRTPKQNANWPRRLRLRASNVEPSRHLERRARQAQRRTQLKLASLSAISGCKPKFKATNSKARQACGLLAICSARANHIRSAILAKRSPKRISDRRWRNTNTSNATPTNLSVSVFGFSGCCLVVLWSFSGCFLVVVWFCGSRSIARSLALWPNALAYLCLSACALNLCFALLCFA